MADQDDDADSDEGVGDVEGRPLVAAPVDEQEIGHVSEREPVGQVTERAAKHAGDRKQQPLLIGGDLMNEVEEYADGDRRGDEEERNSERVVRAGEQAERTPRITGVRDREEPADDRDAVVQRQRVSHVPLGELIEDDYAPGDQRNERRLVHHAISPALMPAPSTARALLRTRLTPTP